MTAESSGINNPNIPVDLENAIRSGRCILLTGCGLLAQIRPEDGYLPASWQDCLYKIVDWCVSRQLIREQEELEAILTLIDEGQLSDAGKKLEGDYLSDKLLRWECLNQILFHESVVQQLIISKLHDLVTQIRFRAYFATTYDTFLEQAFLGNQKTPLDRYYEGSIADAVNAYGKYFESKRPFILKLHGDVKKPDSLFLGDRDFKRLREDAYSSYKNGLKQLLLASSVLCIGFEKTDHDLAYLLAEAGIESKTHINRRNKYWSLVIDAEQGGGGNDSQDERIEIISCRKEELVSFFERLLARLQPHSDQEASNGPHRDGDGTTGIRRDRLQPEQEVFSRNGSSPNSANSDDNLIKIYVSYHQKDADLWKELSNHLEGMNEWIEVQDRNKVGFGKDEKTEVADLISKADIMLLMVSPDFIADDSPKYDTKTVTCSYEVEVAMNRHSKLRIIPIILRSVDWTHERYGSLKSLPGDDTSVHEARDKDKAFKSIAMAIREVVDELRQLQKL